LAAYGARITQPNGCLSVVTTSGAPHMGTIHHETWIKASPAVVFDAITSRSGLDAWWGACLRADPEVGHVIEFDHGLGDPLRMRITEIVPNERVAWRCVSDFPQAVNPASEWLGTSLVFDLRPGEDDAALEWMAPRVGHDLDAGGDLTILDFRHGGWRSPSRWYPFCNAGWGATFGVLARHCESRTTAHH
jgi:uncharacterized protein YndB with AHSA1/START domain